MKLTLAKVLARSFSVLNSLPANIYFLLITFANRLYPDQARQHVGPDLDPNCLTPKIQHPNVVHNNNKARKNNKSNT